jgi:tetratricopeptide (TPR) repeat protein
VVPVHERVNDACELLETGQSGAAARAKTMLQEVVADQPDLALGHFNLGVAHHQLGEYSDARRAYTRAVDLDSTLGEAWLYLGTVQEQEGRLDLAVSNFRTGIRKDPENMDLRVALVSALRQQGRLQEAIDESKAALRLNSTNLAIYNNLGLAYIELGQLDLAKFVYQKALNGVEGAGQNAFIHANLGWTYFRAGQAAEAEYYLQEAVRLDPDLVPALVYLSRIYLDNRNYEDTIPLLESALQRQPDNYGVVMNLGIAYRGVGRHLEAERMYRKALELQPSRPDPWFNMGILYGDHMKDYDRAITALQTYTSRGGSEVLLASEYIADLEKEQERAEKKRALEEDRARREAERAERERLLMEAERQQGSGGNDAPTEPEPAPEPQPTPTPWGEP